MAVIVVRRGLPEEYYRFLRIFAAERGIEIIVDRRSAERRQEAATITEERRQGERRAAPSPTWERADYVLVRRDPEPPPGEAISENRPPLLRRLLRRLVE